MERKDIKLRIESGKLDSLDPHTKQFILDLKRHFNGIIHAVVRWSIANETKAKANNPGAHKTNHHQEEIDPLDKAKEV